MSIRSEKSWKEIGSIFHAGENIVTLIINNEKLVMESSQVPGVNVSVVVIIHYKDISDQGHEMKWSSFDDHWVISNVRVQVVGKKNICHNVPYSLMNTRYKSNCISLCIVPIMHTCMHNMNNNTPHHKYFLEPHNPS